MRVLETFTTYLAAGYQLWSGTEAILELTKKPSTQPITQVDLCSIDNY